MATSLSYGKLLYAALNDSEAIKGRVTKIFPVVVDKAVCPYIAFARQRHEREMMKTGTGVAGADTVEVEIDCFAAHYADAVELAEAVVEQLDGLQYRQDDLYMRACSWTDAFEEFANDAYKIGLMFHLKVR